MQLAAVIFSGKDWLGWVTVILAPALLLLAWGYRRAVVERPVLVACIAFKCLGILLLGLCLLEPLWSGQRARPGANYFTLLADNSQGMQVTDTGADRTRGEWLHQLLTDDDAKWQSRLNEDFQVRRYVFDSRLRSTRNLGELVFDGRASSLFSALTTLGQRYEGQPLAGILLFTDGNATDLEGEALPDLSGLPPVYPVVVGEERPIRDVTIQKVTVSQTSFEDAPVSVQLAVAAFGFGETNLVARVRDANGGVLEAQRERTSASGESVGFRFQLRPPVTGVHFYSVEAGAGEFPPELRDSGESPEATLGNNRRVVVVNRGQGPLRILYVSGRPNWEYKFLNRALADDDQIELTALIRVAKREPKFEFKGLPGDSSNPLFRGFDKTDEETEQYDQPVLVRLNVRDATELRDGFPRTAEELYDYRALILDDLESSFFTRDQMNLIRDFVSDRGGGFLMLGGQESFQQGEYVRTPIGDLLPVYLDYIRDKSVLENLRLSLTREGWLQPWVRLGETEEAERNRLAAMPNFKVVNRTRDIKPGASVLAEVEDEAAGVKYPALVVHRFGDGRVGSMLVGDLWRWGLHRPVESNDLAKAWRQTVRWLVADVPERIQLDVKPIAGDPNHAVQILVRARDKAFKPLDSASVELTVEPVLLGESIEDAEVPPTTVRLAMEPSIEEAGLFEAVYVPRWTGGYKAEAIVRDEKGIEAGRAHNGWAVDFAADEFRSLQPNRALLASIAGKTGGEIIAAEDLEGFAASLPNREVPITENWTRPLWHTPWVFLLALACFVSEWGLRRWKGLT